MISENIQTVETPGPEGLISFDPLLQPLQIIEQLLGQYGDVVRYQSRFGPCFLFVHPEHVHTVLHCNNIQRGSLVKWLLGDGLLASDGSFWKSQRQLMQRLFLPQRIAPFASIMAAETTRTQAQWQAAARSGRPVDIATDMTRLTLRVAVRALFSAELTAQQECSLCEAITRAVTELGRISWTIFGVPTLLTTGSNADLNGARRLIDSFCFDLIAKRRSITPEHRPPDLLTLLLEASNESGVLKDPQVRDEMVTMLVGGHETTAVALSWTWKVLGEQPDIETRLHDEVDRTLNGQETDVAAFSHCHWARAVFQEAMRLYPPVWFMARTAVADEVIRGHLVPKGACVLISTWFTHRHPDFWPDAERFDPARFLEGTQPGFHQHAYLPFGGGRHTCLGMHFGLLEGTLILAKLARRFMVRPLPGQQIRPSFGITLRQLPGLRAHVEMRGAQ
jgi:cytochrome P450